jgi:outer membrane protein assembly factor BamB
VSNNAGADYWFDPRTGRPLDQIPTDPDRTRQILFAGEGVYRLSLGDPATITAYDAATLKVLWTFEGLPAGGQIGFAWPPSFSTQARPEISGVPWDAGRLLYLTEKSLNVVDVKAGRLLTRIGTAKTLGSVLQANSLIVLDDGEGVRAVDPATGKDLWTRAGVRLLDLHPAAPTEAGAEKLVVFAESIRKAPPDEPPELVALAAEDGRELWRWKCPPMGYFVDSLNVTVRPTRGGWIVGRDWFIGE